MSWQALARKEFKEHVRPAGKWSGTVLAAVTMSVLFGIGSTVAVGLVIYGLGELGTPAPSLSLSAISAMLAGLAGATFSATLIPMNLGVDAIAGERERHTLETLLAGPLSDKAILWAKTTAIIGVAVVASTTGAVAVWATLIILYAEVGLLVGLLTIPIGLLSAIVPTFAFTCFAFLFSTRAKTVKDAGQKMSYVMIPMMMLPALGPAFASRSPTFVFVGLIVLVVMAVTMLVVVPILAFAGFRRDRLMA